MKMRYAALAVLIAGGVMAISLTNKENTENTWAADYEAKEKDGKIKASPVYGVIKYNGVLYADEDMKKPIDYLKAGDRVELLQDRARQVYYIKHNTRLGWAEGDILNIPPDEAALTDRLTADEIEGYAQNMRFKSDTDYFVWVDIARQRTYVLKYDDKNVLRLERDILCATGKNQSPTTRGYFTVSDRGESFYNARLGSGAKYWVRFNGSYLFHSIALNSDGSVKDAALGVRRSDGCVRMGMEDIKWFYNNIPEGTGVRVN